MVTLSLRHLELTLMTAVGRLLLMRTCALPFFCMLRTAMRARPLQVVTCDALEVQLHKVTTRRLKHLPVLALAACEPAATRPCSTCSRVGSVVDIPVVGKVYCDGLPIAGKLPAAVEELLYIGS